jgi:hypothetical protein
MRAEGSLDRRSFLSLTASGVLRFVPTCPRDECPTEEYWNAQGYRVAQVLRRVDQVFVQRTARGDGLDVEFVDLETMRGTHIRVGMLCTPAEIGFYAVGSVPYELSLWFKTRDSALEVFVTLESTVAATILVHQERGYAVVVLDTKQDDPVR